MNIKVNFLNGNQYWRDKVNASAARASAVLSDPAFIAKVRAWPGFDFTHKTPAQLADMIQNAGDVQINVGFYRGWFWSKAIAYEANGAVEFNTRKEAYGAGSPGNLSHELMHALGESHNGNQLAGNENCVPNRIGQWVDEAVSA